MKTGEMMMKMTTGKKNNTLKDIFEKQMHNQTLMIAKGMYGEPKKEALPVDDVSLSSYHLLQLMSELGEVLDVDKRWKNFRNKKYDKDAKVEEIADCFIVLMNVAMFSGLSADDIENAVEKKISEVLERINNE